MNPGGSYGIINPSFALAYFGVLAALMFLIWACRR